MNPSKKVLDDLNYYRSERQQMLNHKMDNYVVNSTLYNNVILALIELKANL